MPNNLSCFCFKEKLSCKYDGERSLILHLREKDGKVRTNKEINKSLRQVVTAPTNYTQMVEQMQIFTVLNKIFVGANGKSTRGLGDLVKRMKRNASTLKHMISSDPTYPAQICLSVDKRVQRWLAQCEVADDRTEVNDRVVDFDNLFEDILDCRFFCSLPAVFKVRAPLQPPAVSNPFDQERDRNGRGKKRGVDKVDGGRINNESMIEELKMKENESWENVFCGNNACKRISWSGDAKIKMCPRWHSRGYCFPDCRYAVSHVPDTEVPGAKRIAYKAYLKKVWKK